VDRPQTRYARSGECHIAYQVLGDGELDLVYIPGWVSHLDLHWENPLVSRFFQRLASFTRLIVFDKRGIGLSDRVEADAMPTMEERVDDVRAILDAVGSERAAVLGQGYGCPIAIMFAATHPERTSKLVLYSALAKAGLKTEDYPWGSTPEEEATWRATQGDWGTDEWARSWVARVSPSIAGDERFVDWAARVMRASASPSAARAFFEMNALMDVREILPLIRVPTLVLERGEASLPKGGVDFPPLEEGTWVAERIPGARLVVVPGRDYLPWVGDQDAIVDEVAAFVGDGLVAAEPERVLLTVLFTDMVGSTARAKDSATAGGARCSSSTTRSSAPSSPAIAATRSTAPATACSRPSTGRRERSAALRRSSRSCARKASTSAPASTPARSSCSPTGSEGSPCTSARVWSRRRGPARCSSPRRSAISSRARGSNSKTAGSTT
jgi:pimeloyl-ACP methyl ester carboxylesterase